MIRRNSRTVGKILSFTGGACRTSSGGVIFRREGRFEMDEALE